MFKSMAEVKAANAAAGHRFFSPGAMQFFRSRVEGGLIRGEFFVTSEQQEGHRRMFTLRRVDADGIVSQVGRFQQFETRECAVSAVPSPEVVR